MSIDPQPIITFINNTFKKAGKTTAVIGLSGGIDSAVSFALTAKALGPEHVEAFHLPAKSTNPQHLKDIQELISKFNVQSSNLHIIPINSIIQKSWRIIRSHKTQDTSDKNRAESENSCRRDDFLTQTCPRPQGRSEADISSANGSRVEKNNCVERNRIRLANLSARIRMMILFDAAKKHDALVVGTENRSETLLGYFTRYGDQASDLEPIAHLYKTQVIELAHHLGIPPSIIQKPPSADLWRGQTDAHELGFTYAEADPILALIDEGKKVDGPLADKVLAIVTNNAFKHQVPYRLNK